MHYDYTVEVRNRFTGLDLIECLMNYRWRFVTLYMRQESRPSPRKRNAKKKNGCLRRPSNSCKKRGSVKQRRNRKIYPFECRVPKNSKEREESLSQRSMQIEENGRIGKTRDLFKKIKDTKGTFHAKMGSIKDRNGLDLTETADIKKRWQGYIEELY